MAEDARLEPGAARRSGGMEATDSKLGSAGSLWQDTLAMALTPSKPLYSAGSQGCREGGGRTRALRVVYVFTEDLEKQLPLLCLQEACREVPGTELATVPFGTVMLGDTDTLDRFYNAGESPAPRYLARFLRSFLLSRVLV